MKRNVEEGEMRKIGSLGMMLMILILMVQVSARRTSGQAAPASEEAKRFIGTWRLISDTSTGLMYYDGLGNMAAQVMPTRARAKYAGTQPMK
jgi:hypothetical protein